MPTQEQLRLSYAPVVQRVAPAVVNVYAARWCATATRCSTTRSSAASSACPATAAARLQRSLGSGVIVDPSGLVVTNVHVIEGADEVKVALSDKREFEADDRAQG